MAGQKMLKFVNVERDMPEKRAPNLRNTDVHELKHLLAGHGILLSKG